LAERFEKRAVEIRKTPGFKSAHVDELERILREAIENGNGISTIVD